MKPDRPVFRSKENPPLAKFKVHPTNGALYFEVMVFDTWRDMHKFCVLKNYDGRKEVNRTRAIAYCFNGPRFDKHQKVTKCLGEIIFYSRKISPDVVSHEMNHGAIYWALRSGINPIDDSNARTINGETQEECFVLAQQEMVKQFFDKIAKFDIPSCFSSTNTLKG